MYIYSEVDQKTHDRAVKDLESYEALLLFRLSDPKVDNFDRRRLFIEDEKRNRLLKRLLKLHSILIPIGMSVPIPKDQL